MEPCLGSHVGVVGEENQLARLGCLPPHTACTSTSRGTVQHLILLALVHLGHIRCSPYDRPDHPRDEALRLRPLRSSTLCLVLATLASASMSPESNTMLHMPSTALWLCPPQPMHRHRRGAACPASPAPPSMESHLATSAQRGVPSTHFSHIWSGVLPGMESISMAARGSACSMPGSSRLNLRPGLTCSMSCMSASFRPCACFGLACLVAGSAPGHARFSPAPPGHYPSSLHLGPAWSPA